jgi:hypothetical protein
MDGRHCISYIDLGGPCVLWRKPAGPHVEAFAGAETMGGALMQVFFAVESK